MQARWINVVGTEGGDRAPHLVPFSRESFDGKHDNGGNIIMSNMWLSNIKTLGSGCVPIAILHDSLAM